MNQGSLAEQPADAHDLLAALWEWEARYQAAYPHLNAAEI
jgi:hypothetical protein